MLDFVELIFISCRYPKEDSVLILKFLIKKDSKKQEFKKQEFTEFTKCTRKSNPDEETKTEKKAKIRNPQNIFFSQCLKITKNVSYSTQKVDFSKNMKNDKNETF